MKIIQTFNPINVYTFEQGMTTTRGDYCMHVIWHFFTPSKKRMGTEIAQHNDYDSRRAFREGGASDEDDEDRYFPPGPNDTKKRIIDDRPHNDDNTGDDGLSEDEHPIFHG